jgi:hypothetical protein
MSLLTKPEELKAKKTFKGLIYGQPGIGKTTLALSAPSPVCIDCDDGIMRVKSEFRVPTLQVENYEDILKLLESEELNVFGTIVFDTLGKLIDKICDYVGRQNPRLRQADGQMSQKGWGSVKSTFSALLKLLNNKNKSIIFVAHENEDKNGDEIFKRPDCAGSARKDIVRELDFMGYMEMVGNKRTISFSPSSRFFAKNSLELNDCIEIPSLENGNNFIAEKIVKLTQQKMEEEVELRKEYNKVMKNIDEILEKINTLADLNEAYLKIKGLHHIWSSNLVSGNKLGLKAKDLNAQFNKATNKFELIKTTETV